MTAIPSTSLPRPTWRPNWTAYAVVVAGGLCWVVAGGMVSVFMWGPGR